MIAEGRNCSTSCSHAPALPNVELVMNEGGNLANQASLIYSVIALRSKKSFPQIVVDPVNGKALASKMQASLGAD